MMKLRWPAGSTKVLVLLAIVSLYAGCDSSNPTDPWEGGPPAGAAVTARMSGFFGDGWFSVLPDSWSSYKHPDRTYFNWYGNACSFCVQLPLGYQGPDPATPVTWTISRGGYCADQNHVNVSIEVVDHDAPEGYDRFLAVTGELTFTEFDNENWIYAGTFEFRIGAFSTSDGSVFEYGGDHSLDTTFASGTFDSRIGGMVTAR